MLTILTVTILDILMVIVLKKKSAEEDFIADVVQNVFLFGVILSIFVPISGYEEPVYYKQIELESFTEEKNPEEEVFLKQCGIIYTYKYKSPKIITLEDECDYEIKNKTIIGADVEILKDANCTTPVLQIYRKKAKKSIWTFALWAEKEEYVFYIPKN